MTQIIMNLYVMIAVGVHLFFTHFFLTGDLFNGVKLANKYKQVITANNTNRN
jgi:hypothetical protein